MNPMRDKPVSSYTFYYKITLNRCVVTVQIVKNGLFFEKKNVKRAIEPKPLKPRIFKKHLK